MRPRTYQFGRRYTLYALAVLLGVGTFNIIDRTVINLLLVPIGKDLQLSDTQLGLFAGTAFGIFYALAQIPIARFADRNPRGRIISMALAFWSAMTLLQSWATGFLTLALTRAGGRDRRSGQRSGVDVDDDGSVSAGPSHARVRHTRRAGADRRRDRRTRGRIRARSDRLARRADARRRSRTGLRRDRLAYVARTHARLLSDRTGRAVGGSCAKRCVSCSVCRRSATR